MSLYSGRPHLAKRGSSHTPLAAVSDIGKFREIGLGVLAHTPQLRFCQVIIRIQGECPSAVQNGSSAVSTILEQAGPDRVRMVVCSVQGNGTAQVTDRLILVRAPPAIERIAGRIRDSAKHVDIRVPEPESLGSIEVFYRPLPRAGFLSGSQTCEE